MPKPCSVAAYTLLRSPRYVWIHRAWDHFLLLDACVAHLRHYFRLRCYYTFTPKARFLIWSMERVAELSCITSQVQADGTVADEVWLDPQCPPLFFFFFLSLVCVSRLPLPCRTCWWCPCLPTQRRPKTLSGRSVALPSSWAGRLWLKILGIKHDYRLIWKRWF